MKCKITLLVLSVLLIPGAVLLPSLAAEMLPEAIPTQFRSVVYIDSVSASGEVRRKDSQGLSLDIPVVLDKVLVTRGQLISAGEAVATVNKTATAKRLMELNQYASLASLGAGADLLTSYDDIKTRLPSEITAKQSGTVDTVNAGNGDFLAAGDNVVTLIGSEDLEVIAYISEKNISQIALGQQVLIKGSGFGDTTYHGTIQEISPTAKKQFSGTVQDTVVETIIRFTDADEKIRPGYSAKVQVLTAEPRTLSLLPYEAVKADENGNEYVYVFSAGTAVRREIHTGEELSDGIEIISGVSPEDTVLALSQTVKDGAYVRIQEE